MHTESALKRWLAPLVDPKIFDFWAAHLSRTWRWDRRLARVSAVTPAAEGATTLTLRWGRRAPALLPGQHVNITVDVAGVRHTRAYSPTLLDARQWQITVREQPGGCVSHFLSAPERVGSTLEVSAGFGDMLLPQDQAPWLLLAAGSGITPFLSMAYAIRDGIEDFELTILFGSHHLNHILNIPSVVSRLKRRLLKRNGIGLRRECLLSGRRIRRVNIHIKIRYYLNVIPQLMPEITNIPQRGV